MADDNQNYRMGVPGSIASGAVASFIGLRQTPIVLQAATQFRVPGASRRVGFGVMMSGNDALVTITISPFSFTNSSWGWRLSPTVPLWFDLENFSALVQNEWWILSDAPATVWAVEAFTR